VVEEKNKKTKIFKFFFQVAKSSVIVEGFADRSVVKEKSKDYEVVDAQFDVGSLKIYSR
jgi:hypothetical protein